ncbi:WRKY transcription factor [Musa troglodytarum]|uniref:WRKY transcription factor n=1 Tax=Musa troglodytarum TaxID=320322 RepID=A0A9E7JY19_9LILI|nr:WRKY transcription factor [Musa troglodytarum]
MNGSCSNELDACETEEVEIASEINDARPASPGSGDDSKPVHSLGASTSSPYPKRSRRGVQKRVVTVPISDSKGAGEGAPPPDSWTWRKYGQKPIKGSPFPSELLRLAVEAHWKMDPKSGYYRCSSSKGCPARKQVERSRVDPTVIVVTYAFDHNHTSPLPKNHHHKHAAAAAQPVEEQPLTPQLNQSGTPDSAERDEKFSDLITEEESAFTVHAGGGFPWFADVCSAHPTSPSAVDSDELLYGSVLFAGAATGAALPEELEEAAGGGGGGDDDDSLFAGLGELPEYTVVLRWGLASASWVGTAG